MSSHPFMNAAIAEAEQGLTEGGIPIGSVLVYHNKIIGRGHNRRVQKDSPILHGEMDVLQSTGRLSAEIYRQCTIFTTLSPCAMFSGAILLYEIPKVVIGENTTFRGEEDLLRSKGVETLVLNHQQCIELMQNFIQSRPELWFEDIGTTAQENP